MSDFIKRSRLTTPERSWFDLPAKMREMVINRMDTKTRLKFMQCSISCEKEGISSKNYSRQIMIQKNPHLSVLVGHDKKKFDYFLEFVTVENLTGLQTIVTYKKIVNDSLDVIKWTKIEIGKANDVRTKYVNEFIEKNGIAITEIEIINENNEDDFPVEQCSFKHLKNLKSIVIECNHDLLESGVLDLTQILRADYAAVNETKLTFSQILQFEGTDLVVKSDEFSRKNIRKFLKMWKNGEVNRNMECLGVGLVNSGKRFKGYKIIDDLDVYDFGQCTEECSFRFRLNYRREENCYSEVVYSADNFCVNIGTD